MKIIIKPIILVLFVLVGNLLFSQENLDEEEEVEKIYLIEEYENINNELNEKISYVKEKVSPSEDFYKEILLEYENLQNELMRDMKKAQLGSKEWSEV